MNFCEHASLLLFPPRCLCCGEIMPLPAQPLCKDCLFALGQQKLTGDSRHLFCRGARRLEGVDTVVSSYKYSGAAVDCICNYKFLHRWRATGFLAGEMSADLRDYPFFDELEIVTAVPRSEKWATHALRLGGDVARQCALPFERLLTKLRRTERQHSLDDEGRSTNLKDVFSASLDAANKTVLLCDDIVTSGATLSECARALLAAGAKKVVAATFCATLRS